MPIVWDDPRAVTTELIAWIRPQLAASGEQWLTGALSAHGRDRDAFFASYAAVTRKLGNAVVQGPPPDGLEWLAQATVDELGRAALLCCAAEALTVDAPAFVAECYRQGDDREKRAVLRALPALPEPARFVDVGVLACRTSLDNVFEAIACENPYPRDHFSDNHFNQMVLKAVFVGVALERIAGVRDRTTPDLVRMANDYAAERRAAGRSVPADLERFFGGRE
jgi:hypothetical protein